MSASARTVTAVAALTLVTGAMLPGGSGAAAQTGVEVKVSVPQLMPSDAMTDVTAPAIATTGGFIAHLAVRRDQTSHRTNVRRTNRTTGAFELLNPSIDGGVAPGNYSFPPVVSADGSRVAFTTNGARLVAGDTNGRFDAFVRNASTHTTILTSVASDGGVSNGASGMTSLSKNGRYAVFTSTGTDLVAGSTTTNSDVYRRDLRDHVTVQVTVRPNGAPSRGPGSDSADVSADGNLVAFSSYDTDLAAADGADGENDLFVRTMTTGKTRWLSPGLPSGASPDGVVISPDGRWVSSRWADGSLHLTEVSTAVTSTVMPDAYASLGAFSSAPGRLVFVSGGKPYVRDLATGVNTAINTPGSAATGTVHTVTISADGQLAAYDWAPADGSASRIYWVTLS
jgi:WD40-like Beta Propeller Repeat